jgi:hypothetical protein
MSINWTGIKVGDITGDARTGKGERTESRAQNRKDLHYAIERTENISFVSFYLAEDMTDFRGLQVALNLQNEQILSVKPGVIAVSQNNIRIDPETQSLYLSYHSISELILDSEEPLFTIELVGKEADWTPFVELDRNWTKEIYGQSRVNEIDKIVEKKQAEQDLILFQNNPNPWTDYTSIDIEAPTNGEANLRVYDYTHKLAMQRSLKMTQGMNTIVLSEKDIPQSGMYIVEIEMDGEQRARRMIKID